MRAPDLRPLPGLAAALDTGAVAQLLERRLFVSGDPGRVLAVLVLDVRYRPGGPCWILYETKLRDGDGIAHRLWLSGRLLRDGEAPDPVPETVAARYRSWTGAVIPAPVLHLEEVPMAVYPFPVDGSLPGLFDAADPAFMKRSLGRMGPARRPRVRRVRVEPRSYIPHARAAFFYEVLAEDRRTAIPEMRRLVGKLHARKPAARLFADQWALWKTAAGRIPLAPPVGFLGGVGLTLQEQVRGERLGGLVDRPGFARHARGAARILASLHELRFPLSGRRRAEDEAGVVRRWGGVLAAIRPDLTARISEIESRLIDDILSRHRSSAPIHADFHHTNLLVDGDSLTVIDFDEMACGDPMVDAGRFLASLRVPARRAFGRVDGLAHAGEIFLEEYLRRSGGDEGRARLFEAASLLVAAGSSFRIQRDGYEEEAGLLLDECERVLSLARTGPSIPLTAPLPGPEGPGPWLDDEVYLQALLEPAIRRLHGADLTNCRLEPGSAGLREPRRIRLTGWREGARWERKALGIPGRGKGGPGFLARLERLRRVLAGDPGAFLLPQDLVCSKSLGLLVWDVPEGRRWTEVLGEDEESPALIARAMAAVARAEVELEGRWTWESVTDRIEESLKGPMAREFGRRGEAILAEARPAGAMGPQRPALRGLDPRHLILSNGRITPDRVDEVVLASPGLDAGDFLARLALLGLDTGQEEAVARVAYSFRSAYLEAAPWTPDPALFEAGCLLRLALRRAERGDDRARIDRILSMAEERAAAARPAAEAKRAR